MKPTLIVNNVAQKTLFELELKGQLSDGYWENSRPSNHWELWSEAEVVVDSNNPGRNFYPRRESYAFDSKDLLDVVGDRMLRDVRRALVYGYERAAELHNLTDLNGQIERSTYDGPYWDDKRAKFDALTDAAEIQRVGEDESIYDRKALVKDLRELKKIIKIKN